MQTSAEEAIVRKSIRVRASVKRAFSVFVEQMETWWPATHHLAPEPFALIVVEPRIGGRWYERDAKGTEGDWGRVLAWDPPTRVRLSWHVYHVVDTGEWGCDPDINKASELEIRFIDEGNGQTLVELEHSHLERHGQDVAKLRASFDGPGAWAGILQRFAEHVTGRVDGTEAG